MGHISGKDVYRKLGMKLDRLTTKAPWNDHLYGILKELYSSEEAELIVNMPFSLSSAQKIASSVNREEKEIQAMLQGLCHKGLIFDIWNGREYLYAVNPMVVGIFEFTMMRTDNNVEYAKLSRLFHEYILESQSFVRANSGKNIEVPVMRTLPYFEAISTDSYVEVFDYEKANEIIEMNSEFGLGICSCRHKQEHLGKRHCSVPLETCTSMGTAAQYLIRNNLARKSSKSEMKEILARSREIGLAITADNVRENIGFLCHCCGCCCTLMLAIKKFGYPDILKSSRFIARVDSGKCNGCAKCVKACPIDAITKVKDSSAVVDEKICLGCGVCSIQCNQNAVDLIPGKKRVILPEDSFERIILQSLERNNLHHLFIDNPNTLGQKFLHGLLGGFFKLAPVQKAIMSDKLRSKFLEKVRAGAA